MQADAKNAMGSTEWSILIFLSVIWGGSFFFGKVAVGELGPFTIVFGRVGLAAIALNLVVRATGQRMPSSIKTWKSFLVMGILNNLIPFSLIFWGETRITSGLASILNATTPLWTILLAHALTRDERLSANKLGGVILGLVGLVTMVGWDSLHGLGGNVLAQLAVVGATVSYAFAGIYGKRFKGTPPMITSTGQVTCSAILAAPLAWFVDKLWRLPMPKIQTIGAVVGLALLSTALAYILYFRLLSKAGASNALLVTLLIPVSSLILGTLILGEKIEISQIIGIGLIAFGLALIDWRLFEKIRLRLHSRITAANIEDD